MKISITPRALAGLLGSCCIGFVILLNQFGAFLHHVVEVPFLNPIWEINQYVALFDLDTIILVSFNLIALHFIVFRNNAGFVTSFLQGLFSGFIAFPAVVVALGIIAGALWAVFWVLKLLWMLLSVIAIPFVWLYQQLILPIIKIIGIPFVWLWENVLQPVIDFIGTPFVWLYKHVLYPILSFLVTYIIKPIFIAIAAIIAGLLAMMPFIAIGEVFKKTVEGTFAKTLDSRKIFSYGIGLGFFYFDMVCNYALVYFGVSSQPSISALLPVILGVFFLPYFIIRKHEQAGVPFTFRNKVDYYWEKSQLEFVVQMCLITVALVAGIFSPDENS